MDAGFQEIADQLQVYFDGLYHSDTKRLAKVFHPVQSAWRGLGKYISPMQAAFKGFVNYISFMYGTI